MDSLKLKFLGSLVAAVIGVSLGASATRYTDDTAMMIGLAAKPWQVKKRDDK